MAMPAAREPGPFVTLVRCRTVENDPMLGREFGEREQNIDIVGGLRNSLRKLRSVGSAERGHRVLSVPAILGVVDLRQSFLRPRVRRLR
jgi:hypothetical protein